MQFILAKDLETFIMTDILEDISRASEVNLDMAEGIALEEAKTYLSQRNYDLDKIFLKIEPWNNQKDYKAGDAVLDTDNVVYTAYQDIVDKTKAPKDNVYTLPLGGEWMIKDPRNLLLAKICIDIMLFYLHDALASDKAPELREDNYNRAIHWLEQVAAGKLNPDLPLQEGFEASGAITYGSNTRRVHHY